MSLCGKSAHKEDLGLYSGPQVDLSTVSGAEPGSKLKGQHSRGPRLGTLATLQSLHCVLLFPATFFTGGPGAPSGSTVVIVLVEPAMIFPDGLWSPGCSSPFTRTH